MKVNRKVANIYKSHESLWFYKNIREPTTIDTDGWESARISETLQGPMNIIKLLRRVRTSTKVYDKIWESMDVHEGQRESKIIYES